MLALHPAAILFYRIVKTNDLIKLMVTGWKDVALAPTKPTKNGGTIALIAAIVLAFIAMFFAWGGKPAFDAVPAVVSTEAQAPAAASDAKRAASGW